MIDVVAVGEILMDLIATRKEVSLFDAPSFTPFPGGAPANVAVGVQRWGKSAAFIGKVGRDDFGNGLRALLHQEGVEVRGLLDDPRLLTTVAFVALSATNEPHFAFSAGAHTNLAVTDLALDLFREARIVHGGSVSLAHEPVRATTLAAWELARQQGAICTYDVNWRPMLWPDVAAGLALTRQPLALVDVVKMNAAELRLLTEQSDLHAALLALETTANVVAVTLGAQGCLYRFQGTITEVAAPPVATVVDTTGAGDAFMAALLAGLTDQPQRMHAAAIGDLMARACRAGSLAVTRAGAMPSLPYAHELM